METFEFAKKNNLEGVIAKRKKSFYTGKRTDDWLKIKCYNRQEFVICGYTSSDKNDLISSLILGYYQNNKLKFVGKVGTGFNQKIKEELHALFALIVTQKCPFEDKKIKGREQMLPAFVSRICL